jgi:hypothetical protein
LVFLVFFGLFGLFQSIFSVIFCYFSVIFCHFSHLPIVTFSLFQSFSVIFSLKLSFSLFKLFQSFFGLFQSYLVTFSRFQSKSCAANLPIVQTRTKMIRLCNFIQPPLLSIRSIFVIQFFLF